MQNTFRRLNRRVLNPETGEYEFQIISTVGVNETELDIMKGCSTSSDGVIGLVPAPSAGTNKRYLRCDGTWQEPTSDLPMSGTGTAGLMTPEQVTILNNLNTTVSSLNTTVKNLSSTVSTHTKAIDKNKSDIQALDDDFWDQVDDYNNKFNQVNRTINDHRQTHITDINNLQTQINSKAASNHTHSGLLVFTSTEVVDTRQGLSWNVYTGIGYRPKCVIITPQINIGDAYLYYDFDRSNSSAVRIGIYGNVVQGNIRFSIAIPAGSA